MPDSIDIWRTAKVVIDREGENSSLFAAQRADTLLEAGDMDGAATWRRVKSAIEELQNVAPPSGYEA